MRFAISSCLFGVNCKYNGGNNACTTLIQAMQDQTYILICPEVAGGLPTPRPCCEIVSQRVMNNKHEDVTHAFQQGAMQCIQKIRDYNIDLVITQPRSPSCGKGYIYDGSFQGRLITGNGIFVQLCELYEIPVMNIDEFLDNMHTFL